MRFCTLPAAHLADLAEGKAVLWGAHAWQRILDAAQAGSDVRVFHSGDVGLIGPHGLEILGRGDLCVKLRGRSLPYSVVKALVI